MYKYCGLFFACLYPSLEEQINNALFIRDLMKVDIASYDGDRKHINAAFISRIEKLLKITVPSTFNMIYDLRMINFNRLKLEHHDSMKLMKLIITHMIKRIKVSSDRMYDVLIVNYASAMPDLTACDLALLYVMTKTQTNVVLLSASHDTSRSICWQICVKARPWIDVDKFIMYFAMKYRADCVISIIDIADAERLSWFVEQLGKVMKDHDALDIIAFEEVSTYLGAVIYDTLEVSKNAQLIAAIKNSGLLGRVDRIRTALNDRIADSHYGPDVIDGDLQRSIFKSKKVMHGNKKKSLVERFRNLFRFNPRKDR